MPDIAALQRFAEIFPVRGGWGSIAVTELVLAIQVMGLAARSLLFPGGWRTTLYGSNLPFFDPEWGVATDTTAAVVGAWIVAGAGLVPLLIGILHAYSVHLGVTIAAARLLVRALTSLLMLPALHAVMAVLSCGRGTAAACSASMNVLHQIAACVGGTAIAVLVAGRHLLAFDALHRGANPGARAQSALWMPAAQIAQVIVFHVALVTKSPVAFGIGTIILGASALFGVTFCQPFLSLKMNRVAAAKFGVLCGSGVGVLVAATVPLGGESSIAAVAGGTIGVAIATFTGASARFAHHVAAGLPSRPGQSSTIEYPAGLPRNHLAFPEPASLYESLKRLPPGPSSSTNFVTIRGPSITRIYIASDVELSCRALWTLPSPLPPQLQQYGITVLLKGLARFKSPSIRLALANFLAGPCCRQDAGSFVAAKVAADVHASFSVRTRAAQLSTLLARSTSIDEPALVAATAKHHQLIRAIEQFWGRLATSQVDPEALGADFAELTVMRAEAMELYLHAWDHPSTQLRLQFADFIDFILHDSSDAQKLRESAQNFADHPQDLRVFTEGRSALGYSRAGRMLLLVFVLLVSAILGTGIWSVVASRRSIDLVRVAGDLRYAVAYASVLATAAQAGTLSPSMYQSQMSQIRDDINADFVFLTQGPYRTAALQRHFSETLVTIHSTNVTSEETLASFTRRLIAALSAVASSSAKLHEQFPVLVAGANQDVARRFNDTLTIVRDCAQSDSVAQTWVLSSLAAAVIAAVVIASAVIIGRLRMASATKSGTLEMLSRLPRVYAHDIHQQCLRSVAALSSQGQSRVGSEGPPQRVLRPAPGLEMSLIDAWCKGNVSVTNASDLGEPDLSSIALTMATPQSRLSAVRFSEVGVVWASAFCLGVGAVMALIGTDATHRILDSTRAMRDGIVSSTFVYLQAASVADLGQRYQVDPIADYRRSMVGRLIATEDWAQIEGASDIVNSHRDTIIHMSLMSLEEVNASTFIFGDAFFSNISTIGASLRRDSATALSVRIPSLTAGGVALLFAAAALAFVAAIRSSRRSHGRLAAFAAALLAVGLVSGIVVARNRHSSKLALSALQRDVRVVRGLNQAVMCVWLPTQRLRAAAVSSSIESALIGAGASASCSASDSAEFSVRRHNQIGEFFIWKQLGRPSSLSALPYHPSLDDLRSRLTWGVRKAETDQARALEILSDARQLQLSEAALASIRRAYDGSIDTGGVAATLSSASGLAISYYLIAAAVLSAACLVGAAVLSAADLTRITLLSPAWARRRTGFTAVVAVVAVVIATAWALLVTARLPTRVEDVGAASAREWILSRSACAAHRLARVGLADSVVPAQVRAFATVLASSLPPSHLNFTVSVDVKPVAAASGAASVLALTNTIVTIAGLAAASPTVVAERLPSFVAQLPSVLQELRDFSRSRSRSAQESVSQDVIVLAILCGVALAAVTIAYSYAVRPIMEYLHREMSAADDLLRLIPVAARSQTPAITEFLTSHVSAHHERTQLIASAINDMSQVAVIVIDRDGLVRRLNRAAQVEFGYEASEVIGRNISMLMPESFARRHDSYVQRYLRTGVRRIMERTRRVVGKRKDGFVMPLDLTVKEHGRGTAEPLFVGFIQNVAAQMDEEKAIELNKTMASMTVTPTVTLSCTGTIQHANAAAVRTFGWSESEMIGRSIDLLIPPSPERASISDLICSGPVARSSEPRREVAVSRKGVPFPVELTLREVCDAAGRPQCFIGFIHDLTRELLLAQSVSTHRAVLSVSSVPVVHFDAVTRRVIECSPSALETWGYRDGDVVGQHVGLLFANDPRKKDADLFRSDRRRVSDAPRVIEARRANGDSFFVEVVMKEIERGNGTAVIAFITDLTAKHRREHALRLEATVLAASPMAIIAIDSTGEVLQFNHAAEKLFGCRSEDAVSGSIAQLFPFPAADRHPRRNARRFVVVCGTDEVLRIPARLRDGREIDVEVLVHEIPIDDPSLQLAEFERTLRHEDKRRKKRQLARPQAMQRTKPFRNYLLFVRDAAHSLRNERVGQWLAAVQRMTGAPAVQLDSDGKVLTMNRACCALLGIDASPVGQHFPVAIGYDDVREFNVAAAAGERRYFKCRDGRVFEVMLCAVPRFGVSTTYMGSIRDVTSNVRDCDPALIIPTAFKTSPAALLLANAEGNIVYCSQRCAAMFGWRAPSELTGRKIDVLVSNVRSLLAGGAKARGVLHGVTRDGLHSHIPAEVCPLNDGSGNGGFICAFDDSTAAAYALRISRVERELFDLAPAAILEVDRDRRIVRANQRAHQMLQLAVKSGSAIDDVLRISAVDFTAAMSGVCEFDATGVDETVYLCVAAPLRDNIIMALRPAALSVEVERHAPLTETILRVVAAPLVLVDRDRHMAEHASEAAVALLDSTLGDGWRNKSIAHVFPLPHLSSETAETLISYTAGGRTGLAWRTGGRDGMMWLFRLVDASVPAAAFNARALAAALGWRRLQCSSVPWADAMRRAMRDTSNKFFNICLPAVVVDDADIILHGNRAFSSLAAADDVAGLRLADVCAEGPFGTVTFRGRSPGVWTAVWSASFDRGRLVTFLDPRPSQVTQRCQSTLMCIRECIVVPAFCGAQCDSVSSRIPGGDSTNIIAVGDGPSRVSYRVTVPSAAAAAFPPSADDAGVAVLLLGTSGRVVRASPNVATVFGSDVVGQLLSGIVCADTLQLINWALEALPHGQHMGVVLPGFTQGGAAVEIEFSVVAAKYPVLSHTHCLVARRRFRHGVGGATSRAMLLSMPAPVVVLNRASATVAAASYATSILGQVDLCPGMPGSVLFEPDDLPRLLSATGAESLQVATTRRTRWNVSTRGVGDYLVVVFINPL